MDKSTKPQPLMRIVKEQGAIGIDNFLLDFWENTWRQSQKHYIFKKIINKMLEPGQKNLKLLYGSTQLRCGNT